MNDKPWSDMTDRDRDAAVARDILGLAVKRLARPQTVFYDVDGAMRDCAAGEYVVIDEEGCSLLPYYTLDIRAFHAGVEDEIERRDLIVIYLAALRSIVDNEEPYYAGDWYQQWRLIRATPEQRCEAALKAVGGLP